MHNYDCPECGRNNDMVVLDDDSPHTNMQCPENDCLAEFLVRTADGHGGS